MPLNIRSEEVNRLAEKVAALAKVSKTEAVRIALAHEVERLEGKPSLRERLRPIQDALEAYPRTGLKADKAFYDGLYEES
ncbi:MAG: type II toxin-antitoxin system VapB family antitoxin [Methylobacterium sp.]|jgi:antitoxin VapB|uniref:type II toxin-antitoxin system VapB family antitoxin n=1 Tax=unclassified Methylobacterium TaxID=2615210 RepID=UPI0006F7174C|nr:MULTISPECIES: type II toxin-antitoxin system VapB family antitoxin [unclassified Methylobacterium]KQP06689.1 transcription factor [Methylobacterium sp. Leaf99]MDO9426767.1 type II toxin-antitoxin system VapB family antitoxin [Methylobacterium sp.]TXM71737.1 transcription factor [Methylobacterium sp. WL69]